MVSLGIIGLDTSHPELFAPLLADRDVDISGVWDGGRVRNPGFIDAYCATHGATAYDEPEEMIEAVDGAMILTVDWDTHLELAQPFLEAGVPTLVDKPIVGRLSDVKELESLAASAPVFGGSSVSYHPQLRSIPHGIPGRSLTVSGHLGGYDHPIYYGAHTIDVARRVIGADWTSVSPISDAEMAVMATFENDSNALIHLDAPREDPIFGLYDVSDSVRSELVRTRGADGQRMYGSYLDGFLEGITGDADHTERVVNTAEFTLAVLAALDNNQEIHPGDSTLEQFHADGKAFLKAYADG